MLKVECLPLLEIEDDKLDFAVIIARYKNKYFFVRHHARETLEIPGGHRELDETIETCAKRELFEETGAVDYRLRPLFIYSVTKGDFTDHGQVFFAEVFKKKRQLHHEIIDYQLLKEAPEEWTYPLIQPLLFQEFKKNFESDSYKTIEN